MYEKLESRRLLSSDIQCTLGVVQINGTDGDDEIQVTLQRIEQRPHARGETPLEVSGTQVLVYRSGELTYKESFLDGDLAAVQIESGGGNDSISLINNNCPVITTVHAGAGDDKIDAYLVGDAWPALVYGGDGNDGIVLGGYKSMGGCVACGEGGNDVIYGSAFDDTLYGDFDTPLPAGFAAEAGEDVIYGGEGNDWICGGAGDDWLMGEAGDDYLSGDEGHDVVDGGEGEDLALTDGQDVLINVEQVLIQVTVHNDQNSSASDIADLARAS